MMHRKNYSKLMGAAIVAIAGTSFMPAAIALPTADQDGLLVSQVTSTTSDLPLEPTADPSVGAMKATVEHVTPNQNTILVRTDDGETRYLNVPRGEGDDELNAGDEKVFLMRGDTVVGILDPSEYTAYDTSTSPAEQARAAVRARYEEMRQTRDTTETTVVERQPVTTTTTTRSTVVEQQIQPVRGLW
jgi:hypothetical protein